MIGKRAIQDGPDFICIGMGTSGTGWLFDQLKDHPDFWIPPVKEFRYLKGDVYRPHYELLLKLEKFQRRKEERSEVWSPRRPRDHRDIQFLEGATTLADQPRDLARYAALFRLKGDALSGEITPGYAMLSPDLVADIGAAFPALKIILMVRDPLERAWSILCKRYRDGIIEERLLREPEPLRAFLERRADEYLFPTEVVRRWRESAPQLAFRCFFLDDIARDPDSIRREIFDYLGGDASRPSGGLDAGHNKKAGQPKIALEGEVRRAMIEFFADELREATKLFDGPAKDWPARYGL